MPDQRPEAQFAAPYVLFIKFIFDIISTLGGDLMFKSAYKDRYLLYADNYVENEQEDTSLLNINEAHELIYCKSGRLSANVEGVSYTVNPGEILITRDAEVHKVTPLDFPSEFHHMEFSPYYYYIFDSDYRICRPFTERALGIGCVIPRGKVNSTLIESCFACIAAVPDTYMRRIAVFGALTMILSEINRVFDYEYFDAPADSRSKLLRDIITYINDHLEDDLNPDGIAANLYISRSQLDRIFKQNLGFTLWKYVTFKRLIRARHLLHAGIANNEVARRCGFGDYSTFYKVYTKIFDTPPRAAQPNDTTDPLLKQFYKFDETCSTMDTPGEQFQIIQRIKKLTLD